MGKNWRKNKSIFLVLLANFLFVVLRANDYEGLKQTVLQAITLSNSIPLNKFKISKPHQVNRLTPIINSLIEEYNKDYVLFPLLTKTNTPNIKEKPIKRKFSEVAKEYYFWHPCKNASAAQRVILIANIIDNIEKRKFLQNKPIVISSLGSAGFFQEFLLIKELARLGYKNIKLNLIDLAYKKSPQESVVKYASQKMYEYFQQQPWAKNVNITFYNHIREYIEAAAKNSKEKSHILMLVDSFGLRGPTWLPTIEEKFSELYFPSSSIFEKKVKERGYNAYVIKSEARHRTKKGLKRTPYNHHVFFSSTKKCLFFYTDHEKFLPPPLPKDITWEKRYLFYRDNIGTFMAPIGMYVVIPNFSFEAMQYGILSVIKRHLKEHMLTEKWTTPCISIEMDFSDLIVKAATTNATSYALNQDAIKIITLPADLGTEKAKYQEIAAYVLPTILGFKPGKEYIFVEWYEKKRTYKTGKIIMKS